MTLKYKPGFKLKVKKTNVYNSFKKGEILTVRESTYFGYYDFEEKAGNNGWDRSYVENTLYFIPLSWKEVIEND